MQKHSFGTLADNTGDIAVDLYTLTNKNGVEARIITYGGILVSLRAPDRNGTLGDVVLGFDTLDEYVQHNPFFGCLVGRYGNRIANGRFTLNGVEHTLAQNDGVNHLHGGVRGFDKVVWSAEEAGPNTLVLRYTSPDGEEGYPGTLKVQVTYSLTDDNEWRIHYEATTDKDTVLNLTNHTYFNLNSADTILDHIMQLAAGHYTPTDAGLMPTGEVASVGGTPLDFIAPTRIGDRIDSEFEAVRLAGGYDHNFVVDGTPGELRLAARVTEPTTQRVLEAFTTEPAVQFYSGNFLDSTLTGKDGKRVSRRAGFCLETQHYPDSPNQPNFPTTVLRPGETYDTTTVYRFTVA